MLEATPSSSTERQPCGCNLASRGENLAPRGATDPNYQASEGGDDCTCDDCDCPVCCPGCC
jgi:hypothetical protein